MWDLVVIDEAHKLSAYDYGRKAYLSQRYKVAKELSEFSNHLLLLTATPHRGREDTFYRLMELLDDSIFVNPTITNEKVRERDDNGLNRFFIRRLKEDMLDWNDQKLFRDRATRTVAFELTDDEMELYERVTEYLSKQKQEAQAKQNVHVKLTLTVMQRRLASSIFAIHNTLRKRYEALNSLLEAIGANPDIWKKRFDLSAEVDVLESLDEYDDLDEDQRAALEEIHADPRKLRLFTTAENLRQLEDEAREVKAIFDFSKSIVERNHDESKFTQLITLLQGESFRQQADTKIVIFTENRDTLDYLGSKLKIKHGYDIATIHGGMNVDQRREAQRFFQQSAQIMLCTDAAGEGINLQFCRYLINWDIPWNPNRLEQRMGRIHRYGQKDDVLVFNMVASNTREGKVLRRLIEKIEIIRQSIGSDRVYDVIQDVFEDVSLEEIMQSVFDAKETSFSQKLDQPEDALKLQFEQAINQQKDSLPSHRVAYQKAKYIREESNQQRLQPIYIQRFFEQAFEAIRGEIKPVAARPGLYDINLFPKELSDYIIQRYHRAYYDYQNCSFYFDKELQRKGGSATDNRVQEYLNPGHLLYDSLLGLIRQKFEKDLLQGAVLVSPYDTQPYYLYFTRVRLTDRRKLDPDAPPHVVDERLQAVRQGPENNLSATSPAKFIDLLPPLSYAKQVEVPPARDVEPIKDWVYDNILSDLYSKTKARVLQDVALQKTQLERGFSTLFKDVQLRMSELHNKVALTQQDQETLNNLNNRYEKLFDKKAERMAELDRQCQIVRQAPEVLSCAYVVPLSQVEYEQQFGMARDDEAEDIAIATTLAYERQQGRQPEDVGAKNLGYDVVSIDTDGFMRYIEVKGRSGSQGTVLITENEWNRLRQLGEQAWLYIVLDCKTQSALHRIHNPANNLNPEARSKGIQYILAPNDWKHKAESQNS